MHQEAFGVHDCGEYEIRVYYDDNPEDPREWDNLGTIAAWDKNYDIGEEHPHSDPSDWFESLICGLSSKLCDTMEWWAGNGRHQLLVYIRRKLLIELGGLDLMVPSDIEKLERRANEIAEGYRWKAIEREAAYHIPVMLPLSIRDHGSGVVTLSAEPYNRYYEQESWDNWQNGWIYITREKLIREFGWKRLTKQRIETIKKILLKEVEIYNQYLGGEVYGFTINKKEEDGDEGELIDSCWGFYSIDDLMEAAKSALPSQTHIAAEE